MTPASQPQDLVYAHAETDSTSFIIYIHPERGFASSPLQLEYMNTKYIDSTILLINDIHASKDNIQDFTANWDEALEVCKKNGVSTIAIGGDVWQSRSGQPLSVLMTVRQSLIKASLNNIDIIIEAGNHDKVDPESTLSYNHIFSDYPFVHIVDEFEGFQIGEKTILWLISYFPENGSFTEKLNRIVSEMDHSKKNILYCHEGINGALSKSSDKELPVGIFKPFHKVLVGHYHDRTVLDGGRIEYIGSSRQHNYGEDEQKGYTLLFPDGTTKFIKNNANLKYLTVNIDIANLDEAKRLIEQTDTDNTRIKVKIHCSPEEASALDKGVLLELGASKVEVETQSKVTEAEVKDFETRFDKDGLKAEYSKFCVQKEISEIEMGLKYLEKIGTHVAAN